MQGGHTSFWEIYYYSLQIRTPPRMFINSADSSSELETTKYSCTWMVAPATISGDEQLYSSYFYKLYSWCFDNLHAIINIFSAVDLPTSLNMTEFQENSRSNICISKHGEYLRAEIINSVHAISGSRSHRRWPLRSASR